LTLVVFPISMLLAIGKAAVTYPQHGKIVSERTVKRIYKRPPDPTYHGVYHVNIVVCRIETADRIYELKGPPVGSPIGNEVQFRIKKKHAYILVGTGERRYEITAVEMKPGS
jgi:hypothetical protein